MIKAFYYSMGNFGDVLTPYLVKQLFGVDVAHTSRAANCNFLGIGSILEKLREAPEGVTVWGSGFMYEEDTFSLTQQNVLAVRGKLTAKHLVNKKIETLGDPGLLVNKLVKPEKKLYKIGFIPHYIERKDTISRYIRNLPDVHFIDIIQHPQQFLDEVNRCSFILSSSLHGCITADALNIPNLHLVLSPKVYGKNFKFRDYYSAFDLSHKFLDLQNVVLEEITTRRLLLLLNESYESKDLEKIRESLITSLESHLAKTGEI